MLDIRDHGGPFGGVNRNKYKRWASGSATSDGNYIVTVTGLSFTPSIVYVKYIANGARREAFLVSRDIAQAWGGSGTIQYLLGARAYMTNTGPNYGTDGALPWNQDNDMLSGGFKININYSLTDVTWEAWE